MILRLPILKEIIGLNKLGCAYNNFINYCIRYFCTNYIKSNSFIDPNRSGLRTLSTLYWGKKQLMIKDRSRRENSGKTPGLNEARSANNLSSKQASPFPVFDVQFQMAHSHSHRLTRRTFEYLWQIFNVPASPSISTNCPLISRPNENFSYVTSFGNCDNCGRIDFQRTR